MENMVISHRMELVNFGLHTDDEIKSLSVKEITNPTTFDQFLHPTIGGCYDPALGPTERNEVCATCGATSANCCGHVGHIRLPLPVFNPTHFKTMYQILQSSCFKCHRFVFSTLESHLFLNKMRLVDHGLVTQVEELQEYSQSFMTEPEEMVEEMITAYTDKLIASDCEDKQIWTVKNQQACQHNLMQNFTKDHMMVRGTACKYCRLSWKGVKQENFSRLIILGAQKKKTRQGKGENVKNIEKSKSQETQLQDIVETVEQTELLALDARNHMRKLWCNDENFLKSMYRFLGKSKAEYPTDIFFIQTLAVLPSKFRPIARMRDKSFENPMTANYCRVLDDCKVLESLLDKMVQKELTTETSDLQEMDILNSKYTEINVALHKSWQSMQAHVNCLIDSSLDRLSKEKHPGIKQLLEKKEGLFRKHMMGKRVNFAARTVITPDPCISTNEIGIPEVFATKLTFPQPVTPWNEEELRQAVLNGPNKHPGACYVETEDGHKIILKADRTQREAVANQLLTPSKGKDGIYGTKTVLRHLKNGDMLMMNRQPTLHRPSIQGHRARVLPGLKTMRLHYANCKAYNADFDGDEMNAHYPQSEHARAEAQILSCTDNQYLVPKDGKPLAGLIQDHMIAGVSLTIRGRFFNRYDYCRLIYSALVDKSGPIVMLPPCMIKPHRLWSGKQVLSTVLINVFPEDRKLLNMSGKSKIPEKSWIKDKRKAFSLSHQALFHGEMGESNVIIRNGELLCGVLDKGHYGSTPYGLVHCCYELYGGKIAGKLLTCLGRLFMNSVQLTGFTLGVEDILVTKKGNKRRKKIIQESLTCGNKVAAKAFGLSDDPEEFVLGKRMVDAHFSSDISQLRGLDISMKEQTDEIQNQIVKACMDKNLEKTFPENNLELMVKSGAKGTTVNSMQISCLLGQIELEGHRPPPMLSGRTLPSFLPYDTGPRAGGFVSGRFLTGIKPQEYFFHCMAGREGLVDTAVKTSRSGYLQRCLIKHLEGIMVNYDFTVRDSDGSIIQFYYGEDGLDICKSGFLNEKQFPFLIENRNLSENQHNFKVDKSVRKLEKKILRWQKKNPDTEKKHVSGFLKFCASQSDSILNGNNVPKENAPKVMGDAWRDLGEKMKRKFNKNVGHCLDPVQAKFRPHEKKGVISEKISKAIRTYTQSALFDAISDLDFHGMMNEKIEKSFAEPGDAVGLLSAQSIGEPSTQMTLNTFHFAGRGEMNVTLGIPRLREILMTASKQIKTPNMDIPVFNLREVRKQAKDLQRKFNKVALSDVLEGIRIVEQLSVKKHDRSDRCRIFKVNFKMLPPSCYTQFYATPHSILHFFEKNYIGRLSYIIKSKINHLSKSQLLSMEKVKEASNLPENMDNNDIEPVPIDDGDGEQVSENGDIDAAADKLQKKQQEELEYEDEEEVEEEDVEENVFDLQGNSEDQNEDKGVADDVQSEETRPAQEKKTGSSKKLYQLRVSNVIASHDSVIHYDFDSKKERWCEVTFKYPIHNSKIDLRTIIEDDVRKTVIHEVSDIGKCLLGEQKGPNGPQLHFKTEGVNIQEVYKYAEILDLKQLYTNNIHTISQVYGIEAANRAIIKEIVSVFGAYGIEVDYRHLSLVADYMTFEGSYKPFNRMAFTSSASPFQKMTFETTVSFLVKACMNASTDHLKSPSAQLVTGRLASCGTGAFELLQPLKVQCADVNSEL